MSTDPTFGGGFAGPEARFFNRLRDAISTVLAPRLKAAAADPATAADGVNGGSPYDRTLGTSSYPWKSLHVASGDAPIGSIIDWYDYAGTIPIPQGYMLCDGRTVNQANYDAEHGAGSWETYIGSSALEGKYLPTADDTYFVGTNGPTQDGSTPITTVGAASIDISHAHAASTSAASNWSIGGYGAAGSVYPAVGHTHQITLQSTAKSVGLVPAAIVAKPIMRIA